MSSDPIKDKLDPAKFGLQIDPSRTRFNKTKSKSPKLDEIILSQTSLKITQLEGSHFQKTDAGLQSCEVGDVFTGTTSLFVRSDSLMELKGESGQIVRLGSNTNLDIELNKLFKLYKGAMLLYLPEGTRSYILQSPLSRVSISGNGAAMFGVTEIGGLKVICIDGKIELTLANNESASLTPGELIFVFTEGKDFSRKVDLELATVMQTSALISNFPEPLPFLVNLAKNARKQNRRIRGRFKALVGDAKSDQDFELMILRDKENAEDKKVSDKSNVVSDQGR